jgi:uncharacterized membrane protein
MILLKFSVFTIFITIVLIVLLLLVFIKVKKIVLKLTRLILFLILILLVFNTKYRLIKKLNKINVCFLVDNSYSMKFNNRLTKINEFLQKNSYKLSQRYNFKFYTFNTDLYETKLSSLEYTTSGTRINYVVDKLISDLKEPYYVFLFSDGINNTEELPVIKKENVVLIPVTFNEQNFCDVSIYNVRFSKIGFKDVEHKIKLELFSYGYNDNYCKVKLYNISTNEVLDITDVMLKNGITEVTLKFVPKLVGKFKLKIEVSKMSNEISYENNNYIFDLEIKKNKIRVLYICGQPSPEYFHLRNLLKNDPSVDLVSFVILRNPEDISIVPDEDSALIPFPTYDIFVKELFNYDLFIFENFTYTRFGIPIQYLENLKKFVLSGGGFIMIGGENSFFLGGYKYTPIEDILPVVLSEKEEWIYEEYRPEVVDYNNLLVKILDDKKENELMWQFIPMLGNYQKVGGVKDDAVVVFKYKGLPIMCYTEKSKGRVFVSMTNTTWRWTLGNILSEKYDYKELYTKFWKNIIYFISGAEELKNIYIIADDNYNVGQQVDLQIITNLNEEVKPELVIQYPNKTKKVLDVRKITEGKFLSNFVANVEGKYKISAIAKLGKKVYTDDKEIYVGETAAKEIALLKTDIDYIKKLSEIYNTKLIHLEKLNLDDTINEYKSRIVSQEMESVFEIYRLPYLSVIFIILFLLEIFIVRYKL